VRAYEEQLGESFDHLQKEADLYFSETGKVHSTLAELPRKLEQAASRMPYWAPSLSPGTAIAG